MPLYDYQCQQCGIHEEFQSMKDDLLTVCPRCQEPYAKLVSCPSGAMEREYHKPIELHSIAPSNAQEERAFRRRNPGVDFQNGAPLARTRRQKLAILKNEGFQERK